MMYWVNVSESSGAGLPGLSRPKAHETVVIVFLFYTGCFVVLVTVTGAPNIRDDD